MQSDMDFLGLVATEGTGQCEFEVIERLARFDGRLYGGTAVAVSIAAAEVLSERQALWMTTQFLSAIEMGDRVCVNAEILAGHGRINQVRVTGTSISGEVVFASLGATGIHRPEGLRGTFDTCPTVEPPDRSERWDSPFTGVLKAAGLATDALPQGTKGFAGAIEVREPAITDHPETGPGRFCLWARRKDQYRFTPAIAAYLADIVPLGVAHALQVVAGGTSLDNTIRIGSFTETEWVLLDLRPYFSAGGYGHGAAHIWSEDGELLATASQTAAMIEFDLSQIAALVDDNP